jgi:hypothetical protein
VCTYSPSRKCRDRAKQGEQMELGAPAWLRFLTSVCSWERFRAASLTCQQDSCSGCLCLRCCISQQECGQNVTFAAPTRACHNTEVALLAQYGGLLFIHTCVRVDSPCAHVYKGTHTHTHTPCFPCALAKSNTLNGRATKFVPPMVPVSTIFKFNFQFPPCQAPGC